MGINLVTSLYQKSPPLETPIFHTEFTLNPIWGKKIIHIWNGLTALEPFTSKERWFLEGVTNYYSDITAKQLGYLSESEYLKRLESACEKYLAVSNEFAVGDDFRDKGVSDNPPTESEVVVRITKKAGTTKLQRAILASILSNN